MNHLRIICAGALLVIISCATPPVWREVNGVRRNLAEGNNYISDCAVRESRDDLSETVTLALEAENDRNNFRYEGDSRWYYMQVDENVYAKIAAADADARHIMLGRTFVFADVYIEKGRHSVEAIRSITNVKTAAEDILSPVSVVVKKLAVPPSGTNADVNNEHRFFIMYRVSDLTWIKSTNTSVGRTELIRKMFDTKIAGEGFCTTVFDFAKSLYAAKKYDTIDAVSTYLTANVKRDVNDVYQSDKSNPFRKNNAYYINALAFWRLAAYAKERSLYASAALEFKRAIARTPDHERMVNQKYALIAGMLARDAEDMAADTKGAMLRFHLFNRSKISDLSEF
ncbi:MAG: hypothetical protein AABZ39_01930 [Spirochaetota bacterium]